MSDALDVRCAGRWACGVALAVVLAMPASPAAAGDAADARADADRVAARVDHLVERLDRQVAAEEAALAGVATGVQTAVSARARADDAALQAAGTRARHGRVARALYADGGPLAVYSSLLGSASVEDLLSRHVVAGRVLRAAGEDALAAAAIRQDAVASATAADAEATGRVATAADVTAASAAVEATLVDARQHLADLDARAERLEAAEEARRRWEEAERAAAAARSASAASAATRVTAIGIPPDYEHLYQRGAASCPGLRWTLLAAVGQVESRHGAVTGPSSAGAVGPMQFLPSTFAAFGVDGDGDGVADPWSPADAVLSAAAYLCHSGAGAGTPETDRRALLRYNNAGWYVALVLGVEADILARAAAAASG